MARSVTLDSAPGVREYGWLRFDEPSYWPEFGCTFTFARAGDETSVSITMLEHWTDALRAFARALEQPTSSLEAPLAWESEDGEVQLTVSLDGQLARVGCVMRWPPEWATHDLGTIDVDSAELASFAGRLREFVTG